MGGRSLQAFITLCLLGSAVLTQSIVSQDAVPPRHDQKHSPSILRRVASEIISLFTRRMRGGRRRVSSVSPHRHSPPIVQKRAFSFGDTFEACKISHASFVSLGAETCFMAHPILLRGTVYKKQGKVPIRELYSAKKKQHFENYPRPQSKVLSDVCCYRGIQANCCILSICLQYKQRGILKKMYGSFFTSKCLLYTLGGQTCFFNDRRILLQNILTTWKFIECPCNWDKWKPYI
jgi:hypothetical protein